MDPLSYLWEAAQYLTCGRRNNVFSPDAMRGYLLFHHPHIPRGAVAAAMTAGEAIYWRPVGTYLMMTPLGSAHLWLRYGKPSARNKNPERQNATARYFAHVWTRLISYAQTKLAKKLPRSAELNKIDDHIMGWIALAIERNYLAKYLVHGTIAPSLVCHFMFNKACSDLRKDGRDPSCRALHGALAPHEVQARKDDEVPWTERMETAPVITGEDPLSNMADNSQALEQMDLEQMSMFIAKLLEHRFQDLNLMQVYEFQFDLELGVDETARRMNVDRAKVRAARKEIKRLVEEQRPQVRRMQAQALAVA